MLVYHDAYSDIISKVVCDEARYWLDYNTRDNSVIMQRQQTKYGVVWSAVHKEQNIDLTWLDNIRFPIYYAIGGNQCLSLHGNCPVYYNQLVVVAVYGIIII